MTITFDKSLSTLLMFVANQAQIAPVNINPFFWSDSSLAIRFSIS